MSARSVLNALDREKYEVIQIGVTHAGKWFVGEDVLGALGNGQTAGLTPVTLLPDPSLPGLRCLDQASSGDYIGGVVPLDVVFPVLHGTFGEDGTLQGLFEMAGLAYIGAGVLGSSLCMDKGVFREVMLANNIPVTESAVILRSEIDKDINQVIDRVEAQAREWKLISGESIATLSPYPLFVKPANLGSSVGISKCRSRADLLEGLLDAARFDRRVIVQRAVNAREIEVSVLGNDNPQASVPGEIIPSREFYSYEAKYIDNASKLIIPAPIPFETSEEARTLSVRAYRASDCSGMARVDFLLDKDTGRLYLNEINTIPGFTHISMYPKLWEASGLSYPALLDRLVDLALERKAERDRTVYRYGQNKGKD
jgi:D-alanine-D-alanine ligase